VRIGLAVALGYGFLAAAPMSALLAMDEVRTRTVNAALTAADAEGASAERRAAALSRADASLSFGAPTGALRELAAARALQSDPPDLDLAEKRTWEALARSPARAEAWARLAFIDAMRHGALSSEGLSALALSYEVEPFGPEALRHWRVEFILARWSEVGDDLRQAALREASGATSGGARWYEETLWTSALAERLPAPAADALRAAMAASAPR
jgi:hypothetical protein